MEEADLSTRLALLLHENNDGRKEIPSRAGDQRKRSARKRTERKSLEFVERARRFTRRRNLTPMIDQVKGEKTMTNHKTGTSVQGKLMVES